MIPVRRGFSLFLPSLHSLLGDTPVTIDESIIRSGRPEDSSPTRILKHLEWEFDTV